MRARHGDRDARIDKQPWGRMTIHVPNARGPEASVPGPGLFAEAAPDHSGGQIGMCLSRYVLFIEFSHRFWPLLGHYADDT